DFEDFHLRDINLKVERGEYFVVLGPSGAGKTILFETIAGLVKPDKGTLVLEGTDITRLPISQREVGIVFQDGAVFPHMTVRRNLGYALRSKHLKKPEVEKRVTELGHAVGILHLLHRKPSTLSGGELQRVAIARTLAREPHILLLDEPLASLDYQLRQEIRDLLKGLNRKGLTIMHITHDYHEAFYLADKLAIIDQGKIIQTGTPEEVISHPGSRFVAGFIGIRNSYQFKKSDERTVMLEDKIQLSAQTTLSSGILLIPNDGIHLHPEILPVVKNTEFAGKVMHKVRFPENVLLIIDIGIILHYFCHPDSEKLLRTDIGDDVMVMIDAQKMIFQEK
ncbi:MAG: ABC transporter ATP-binding protein, partial [Bacteroidales bacterium]